MFLLIFNFGTPSQGSALASAYNVFPPGINWLPLTTTVNMTSKDYKKIIADKLADSLKPRHFKKTPNNFQFSNGDLTYFIGLQSSQSSTSDVLKATVNIEIASSLLSKFDDGGLPEKDVRHYHLRIGFFLENPTDKWWIVNSVDSAIKSADEINEILTTNVFKIFDELKSTKDFVTLWRQGKSPGLTEGQRKMFLKLYDDNYGDK